MNRIKELREAMQLSMSDVSKKLGIPYTTYVNYEKCTREPNSEMLIAIADFFDVSIDYLLCRSNDKAKKLVPHYSETLTLLPNNIDTHCIPLLGKVSAGIPLYAEENIEGFTYTERNGGAEYFALKITGDSMTAAGIKDNDTIIVKVQNVVENGEIAVVRVDKESATVKRFRQEGNTVHLIPQSFNPVHQVQTYNLKNTKIDVIGKVVECRTEF